TRFSRDWSSDVCSSDLKSENADVDSDGLDLAQRKVQVIQPEEMKQQSITPGRERQCGRSAQYCQQQAFRQQLTRHAEAWSAKSTTNREFLLACRTAGQQQIGDVNAGNEQHKSNGCHQSRHRCF